MSLGDILLDLQGRSRPQIWLSYNKGAEKLRLPVNPSTLNVKSPFGVTDVEVARMGEFTVIGYRGLKEYSFGSFFPRDYNSTYCEYSQLEPPRVYVSTIEKWRDNRYPLRLTITGTNINTPVTIREFDYEFERAGNPGDIYFDITLKEFEFHEIRREQVIVPKPKPTTPTTKPTTPTKVTQPVKARPAPTAPKKKVRTHLVTRNESLWIISKRYYGKGSSWRTIYNANKGVIGGNPNKLKVGQRLVIP
jgi:LysM domain